MASGNNARGQRVSHQPVSTALSSAAAEWLLMLLLFLDGLFSFLVTKFAHHFKLQKPCLFCSRLDHILGQERPGFYKDLICHAHKLEISSSAFCHIHEKLADVRDMCEACLLSFATEKKSNSETYRSLVGKLEIHLVTGEDAHLRLPASIYHDGLDVKFQGEDVAQVPLLDNQTPDSPRTRYCSCCHALFSKKSHVHRLLQTKSIGAEDQELDVDFFGQSGHDGLHGGDGSSKRQEKPLRSAASSRIENQSLAPLSHIGYTELKVTSDSESEVPLSDDDDDGSAPVGTDDLKVEMLSQSLEREPYVNSENQNVLPKTLLDEMAPEKQIHPSSILPEPSSLLPMEQIHLVEHHNGDSLVPRSTTEHGLEELSGNEFKERDQTSPTSPSKHISEIPDLNLDDAQVSHVEHCAATTEGNDHPPVLDKVISEVSNSKLDKMEIGDPALVSSATNVEEQKNLTSTDMGLRQIQTTSEPGSLMHNHMDLNDAYKLAVSYRMNQPSPRDSYRVHEDLRVLLSQISAARGLELPWGDTTPSPRVYGQGDDLKMSDASSTASQQNLYKRLSIERNESGFESLDGSIVSEIEGESPIDRLKRQIEVDRKSMNLLYKELEEERNASAIAANQAMAMITRLQEEKAAMQMEALQYQRMMEEQAEYDQEVLQNSNDLLAQKEEELQDLKAEIGSYKKWLGVETSPTKMKGDLELNEGTVCRPFVKLPDGKKILERNDTVFLDAEGDGAILKNSALDFNDEKVYISECLKNLERKLHLFSNNGVQVDFPKPYVNVREDVLPVPVLGNGHWHEKGTSELNNLEQGHWQEMAQEGSQLRDDSLLNQKELSFDGEDSHLNGELTNKGNHNSVSRLPKFEGESLQSTMISRTPDLVDIGNEVLHLNYRLEALEADRSFLEHTMNSLRSGNDGIQLVQEIAGHLRELRTIGVRRKEQAFT